MEGENFQEQFTRTQQMWIKNTDFPTWYRYLIIFQEISEKKFKRVLEIGPGSGVIHMLLKNEYPDYKTMDINADLHPDYIGDIAEYNPDLNDLFDCIICNDVLEHLSFDTFIPSLKNICAYLHIGGKVYLTIPHVRKEIMIISRYPFYKIFFLSLPYWLSPHGFYRWFFKKTITIDPYHYWELGNQKVTEQDIHSAIQASGFRIEKIKKIPYVDLYILVK